MRRGEWDEADLLAVAKNGNGDRPANVDVITTPDAFFIRQRHAGNTLARATDDVAALLDLLDDALGLSGGRRVGDGNGACKHGPDGAG